MFTKNTINQVITFGLFTIVTLFVASDANAQRWRSNRRLQRSYNNQQATQHLVNASLAASNGHGYLAQQGYSNAMQMAYGQAYSNNHRVRARGLRVLQRLSDSPGVQQHIRQTADNAYYQASQYHDQNLAQLRQVRMQNVQTALNIVARNFSNNQVKVNPRYARQYSAARSSANRTAMHNGGARKQTREIWMPAK